LNIGADDYITYLKNYATFCREKIEAGKLMIVYLGLFFNAPKDKQ